MKVTLANQLPEFVVEVIWDLYHQRVFFTVESPLNSYLWLLPQYMAIAALPGVRFVRFQSWHAQRPQAEEAGVDDQKYRRYTPSRCS